MTTTKTLCMGLMLSALPLFSGYSLTANATNVPSTQSSRIGMGNPYVPLWEHMPDGEPRVFEDPDNPGKYRVYVAGSHDVDPYGYCGVDTHMWSAPVDDLTQWRNEGPILVMKGQKTWDVMFAPDIVELKRKDGSKEYYLYPNSCGDHRREMVLKSSRPDGPYTPINLGADGKVTKGDIGFDPGVFIDYITDPKDPDYATGYRVYAFWGFEHSYAQQLDPTNMYSRREGGEFIDHFLPACNGRRQPKDPKGTTYPAIFPGQTIHDFSFYEASSMRKIGNKYIMIYSGSSGDEYGLSNCNGALRYAYGDTPLGPWRSAGVLVDARGVMPNENGSKLIATNDVNNTHGSLQFINGQWYVFYHRTPRGFGFSRQPMVAPVTIQWDKKSVADGGKVTIRAYDPYAKKNTWTAKAADGNEYTGAEVTSEGFQIFGLPPYRYYSAGYACYFTNKQSLQDSWDIWDNNMPVDVNGGDIVGYKYFGFGGLNRPQKGLPAFEGTRKGNKTLFNLFVKSTSDKDFRIAVWLDAPWNNKTWKGKRLGEITIPAGQGNKVSKQTLDVSSWVDGLSGKHAIYLVAEGNDKTLGQLIGLGFTKQGEDMQYQAPPTITISMNGRKLDVPTQPTRMPKENGTVDYTTYDVYALLKEGERTAPHITAESDNKDVQIEITQPESRRDKALVKCVYQGMVKNYTIHIR